MKVYFSQLTHSHFILCSVIQEMLRLETAIDKCIKGLNERIDRLTPDNDWDDVESITSATTSRFKTLGARRENELLKQKVLSLELENIEMKKQLELMQKKFGIKVNDALPPDPSPANLEFVTCDRAISSASQLGNEIKRRFFKKDK